MKLLAAIIRARWVFWPLLALPALPAWYFHAGVANDTWEFDRAQDFLGNTAVVLLIFVLCLTPLRVLFPRSSLVAALNRHRRAIGISCFLYALWHVYLFFVQSTSVTEVLEDFADMIYLQVGFAAFLCLGLLFITSNNLMVRLLGYPLWKLLHRLAYVVAVLIFVHRGFGNEQDALLETVLLFFPLIVLELFRVTRQFVGFVMGVIRKRRDRPAWKGLREFKVVRKVPEGGGICSFYLSPVDGKALPRFRPGQYLTFSLDVPDREEPLIRCYSLSDAPNADHYRVSIKKVPPPRDHPEFAPGVSSSFFHEQIEEGAMLRVQAPGGGFVLDPKGSNPVVLIGSGIGLTPVMSMLRAMIQMKSKRKIWFFQGARNSDEHIMKSLFSEAEAACPNFHGLVCYSSPNETDVLGEDYHLAGRIDMELLKRTLSSAKYDFYFCGPGPMMEELAGGLEQWGVLPERIHFEAFGPSSIRKKVGVESATIRLRKSKQEISWDNRNSSILELAEAKGKKLRFGCRAGVCGTCAVKVVSGEVVYANEPTAQRRSTHCLTCVGVPNGDLELDV